MHGVFAFSFGGHGSGRHLADGSLIIRGGLYAGNEVSCNRGEFRVDVRHSELRLPRLRRKHGLCRPSVQVPRQVSAGLARNLGASPVRWFRQTIDKGDQSELISEERIHIKQTLPLVLVISASVLLAQDNNAPKGFGDSTTTEQDYKEGTLVVDKFDAKSKQLIWRSSAEGTLSDSAAKNEKNLDRGVARMLKEFPPESGNR